MPSVRSRLEAGGAAIGGGGGEGEGYRVRSRVYRATGFAPVWKQVARQACAAAPRLEFVAVDCASDFLLCQEMKVPSFPSIRLFGPGLPTLGHELSACPHGCQTSAEVLDDVVHLVREIAPSAVPAVSFTELSELSERSSCAQAVGRPGLPLAVYSSDLRQGEAPPAATQVLAGALPLVPLGCLRAHPDLPPPSADACAPRRPEQRRAVRAAAGALATPARGRARAPRRADCVAADARFALPR